jgi:hypothetical protein
MASGAQESSRPETVLLDALSHGTPLHGSRLCGLSYGLEALATSLDLLASMSTTA